MGQVVAAPNASNARRLGGSAEAGRVAGLIKTMMDVWFFV
jgi:hypothetical protein